MTNEARSLRNCIGAIPGAVLIAAAVVLIVQTARYRGYFDLALLVSLAPGLALLTVHFAAGKVKQGARRRWPVVVWVLGVVGTLWVTSIAAGFWLFSVSASEIVNPANYEAILNASAPGWHAHFPDRIPPAASNVRFFYRPGFLQSGFSLQLRCKLPASAISRTYEQNVPIAKQINNGSPDIFHYFNSGDGSEYATATFRNERNTGFAPLPKDFKVMVLGGRAPDYVHDVSWGLAVSKKRSEVIYWSESW